MKCGANKSIDEQLKIFKAILFKNEKLYKALKVLQTSKLKDYYIGAGSINQTIFNYYHNYEIDFGIKDYDIVYFDEDISYEKEDETIKYINDLLKDLDIKIDIKNEARVHLWYEQKFGFPIVPYKSVEEAISRWATTITCIGVRLENDQLIVCAPYGLNDIFNMVIRPIKEDFEKEQYETRVVNWIKKWPMLKVIPWDDEV